MHKVISSMVLLRMRRSCVTRTPTVSTSASWEGDVASCPVTWCRRSTTRRQPAGPVDRQRASTTWLEVDWRTVPTRCELANRSIRRHRDVITDTTVDYCFFVRDRLKVK